MTVLSVVIITKNQEWNATRLIESVLDQCGGFPKMKITLVDSASSDNTLAIAKGYPLKLIRLSQPQRLTAAMGRYVGFKHSFGEYILFLDGDMELCRGWVECALEIMANDPQIAAITGQIIDRPKATPRN